MSGLGFATLTKEECKTLEYLQEALEGAGVQGSDRLEILSEAIRYCEENKLSAAQLSLINPSLQIFYIKEFFEESGGLNKENKKKLLKLSERIQNIMQQVLKKPLEKKSLQPESAP